MPIALSSDRPNNRSALAFPQRTRPDPPTTITTSGKSRSNLIMEASSYGPGFHG